MFLLSSCPHRLHHPTCPWSVAVVDVVFVLCFLPIHLSGLASVHKLRCYIGCIGETTTITTTTTATTATITITTATTTTTTATTTTIITIATTATKRCFVFVSTGV